MTPASLSNLNLSKRLTNIDIKKINRLALRTYEMTTTRFSIQNEENKNLFLGKMCLLADTIIEVISKIFFVLLNNINLYFDAKKFT